MHPSTPAARLCSLLLALSACGRTDVLNPRTAPPLPDAATPLPCELQVSPDAVDFGEVLVGTESARAVTLTNWGGTSCRVLTSQLAEGADAQYALRGPVPPYELAPGEALTLTPVFAPTSRELPRERTATLVVIVDGLPPAVSRVPLRASIAVGCELRVTPEVMNFGAVALNRTASSSLRLENHGTSACEVSQVALGAETDRLFSLVEPPTVLVLPPDPTVAQALRARFSGTDSAEPHLRTGTLHFHVRSVGAPALPDEDRVVPLRAFISTDCVEGSRWIYTVASDGRFAAFNPETLQYSDISVLSCPDPTTPFSMAVDQLAVAWVEYTSGAVYRVDTRRGTCGATAFSVNPALTAFGMGFVFDADAGRDTLYVAGGTSYGQIPSMLGTLDFSLMRAVPLAPLAFGSPELTGTGDGQLWGFAPSFVSADWTTVLVQIDPSEGLELKRYVLPQLDVPSASFALAFWGGSFWAFLGSTVYTVDRQTGEVRKRLDTPGREIVGVGVSTCAPLE